MTNSRFSVDAMQRLLTPLFPGLMGMRIVSLESDRIVAQLEVRESLCTTGGVMHGGAYMAFADTLGAIGTVINLP